MDLPASLFIVFFKKIWNRDDAPISNPRWSRGIFGLFDSHSGRPAALQRPSPHFFSPSPLFPYLSPCISRSPEGLGSLVRPLLATFGLSFSFRRFLSFLLLRSIFAGILDRTSEPHRLAVGTVRHVLAVRQTMLHNFAPSCELVAGLDIIHLYYAVWIISLDSSILLSACIVS